MKKCVVVVCAVLCIAVFAGCATGLPTFGAEIGKESLPLLGETRIPYLAVSSYYGYVKPGSPADATVNGKKMYYVYIWVPVVAPEIGVRMISPVPAENQPTEADFVSATWEDGKADTTNFFDTWISFDRSETVLNPEDITKAANGNWINFDTNDDSGEMPPNPRGQKYNSLLRVVSDTSNPLKSLVRGLYRISFTTYKVGEVQGSFLAQVGAPVEIPGIVIGASLKEVQEKALASK
jgi:hypothetical protein